MEKCPVCKQEYERLRVLSMKDNKTLICPACGLLEVYERDGNKLKKFKCPRCGRVTSAPYAISRFDGKTKICPICGMVEALESLKGEVLDPNGGNCNGKI